MAAAAAATSSPNPRYSLSVSDGSEEREKTTVAAHPLYEQLLEDHVACFRVASPGDQLPPHVRTYRGQAAPARRCNRDCGRSLSQTPTTSPPPPSSPPLPPTRSRFPPTPPSPSKSHH
ncbi:hypothetical protein ACQ4PT_028022 [Festuca glaucescens]